ncbi:MAG TPA: IS1595 family transposase [Bacteroidia bacterium]|jgi:transposase-like protein|nr:IS1595 family transposase [Bacteroidia bacterium]
MTTQFKSLLQVLDYFKEETTCVKYLAVQRWGETPCCPHCGNVGAYVTNRGFKCKAKECGKKFTVTTASIFENTKISLRYWFATIYLVTAHKKGISSLQLSRDLEITQKTAWFLLHRVRAMLANNAPAMLDGTVEVDETYVGGKSKNKHVSKRIPNSQGRSGNGKTAVVGLLERNGFVKTFVIDNTEANTLQPIMLANVNPTATVVTDAYRSYNGLNVVYNHITVKHTENNYITVGEDHTNNIEGFWSLLKRGIIGIYHNVSPKHLHRYCNEFGFRYNSRKITDVTRFENAFSCVNIRLTYANLIA